jgi:formylglycine-generating enzyme required for sulfatase activity
MLIPNRLFTNRLRYSFVFLSVLGLIAMGSEPAGAAGSDGMVLVPSGWFVMGSSDGGSDEKPLRRVWVDEFYIDRHEVTNQDFARFLNREAHQSPDDHWTVLSKVGQFGLELRGSRFRPKANMARMPVVFISWRDAYEYCRWRGKGLPSEAQWERACLLGSQGQKGTPGFFSLERSQNIHRWWNPRPDPVGSHAPDSLGLYDMLGNVAEYTEDLYLRDWHEKMPRKNPVNLKAPAPTRKILADNGRVRVSIIRRVAKGGSFSTNPNCARCSFRSFRNQYQADMNNFTGFRCVIAKRLVRK